MTEVSENEFLAKLLEVVYKLSNIVKAQSYRFINKWDEYLRPINDKPHIVRQIPLDKKQFIDDIDYRIQVLKNVEQAVVDGLYAIKSVLKTLYDRYFVSELFKNDFSEEDQLVLKYLVSKEILGNLIQYNILDHESVPMKYNVIARNYTLMKFRPITDTEILNNLNRLHIENLELADINSLMEEVKTDGIISITEVDDEYHYEIVRPLELTPEGKKHYSNFLAPIVDWPTGFWRSFYNIRELNVTPKERCKHRNFLLETLSKTATQGYSPMHYVFHNLIRYYEMIKEETV
ncbi:MAG: hypothetical protein ACFFCI_22190 [Promethearchaeota archaeon]